MKKISLLLLATGLLLIAKPVINEVSTHENAAGEIIPSFHDVPGRP
ncbi:hypothetical protein [Fictibacillus macauensis]|nr:hypothetical protein [Fictibacillus macauensis]